MEPAGQSAHVECRRQLEFTIVPGTKQRGVDDVVLDFCEGPVGRNEVPLPFVVEACQPSEVSGDAKPHLPGVDESDHAAEDEQSDTGKVIVDNFIDIESRTSTAIALLQILRCQRQPNQGPPKKEKLHCEQKTNLETET